jgi:excisionase family DNA binding protein
MKLKLEEADIEKIVDSVVDQLAPLLRQNSKSDDSELMDVKGLAKYLKVKESWVYEKIHTKKIPFVKAGRFPRFRKKHIDKWLANPYSAASRAYRPLNKEGEDI